DPARDLSEGFIGIQNHGSGESVYYRNIQIDELDGEEPGDPGEPAELMAGWGESLESYVDAGDVSWVDAHQLSGALEQAQGHLEGEQVVQARRAMERFVRHLDHPHRPGSFSDEAREDLREQASAIVELLQ